MVIYGVEGLAQVGIQPPSGLAQDASSAARMRRRHPLPHPTGTRLGGAVFSIQAWIDRCVNSMKSRLCRRQISITLNEWAMNSSQRRDRLGPEILRSSTRGRMARSASLFVGSASGRVTKGISDTHPNVLTSAIH